MPNNDKPVINDNVKLSDRKTASRILYFINEVVEWDLTNYLWTNCTDVELRDRIMSHAPELIRQIIRKQNLHRIYPGQDESSFGDLVQTAYIQIERCIYKYRSVPHCRTCYRTNNPHKSQLYIPGEFEYGIITYDELFKRVQDEDRTGKILIKGTKHFKCPNCDSALNDGDIVEPIQGRFGGSSTILFKGQSKVFNMWSQIARTVMLAYVKREARDRKNSGSYREFVGEKPQFDCDRLARFFEEATEIFDNNKSNIKMLKALEEVMTMTDRPHEMLASKLVEASGCSKQEVAAFLNIIRLRSSEFSDAPANNNSGRPAKRSGHSVELDQNEYEDFD